MRIELETHHIVVEGQKPIDLYDICTYHNSKGQRCLSFSSRNHTYLKVRDTTKPLCGADGERHSYIGVTITVEDPIYDDIHNHVGFVDIHMTPENQKEADELHGIMVKLGPRYDCKICFVEYDDMYEPKK